MTMSGDFFFLIYFIYFWLHWVFPAACGLSLVALSGGCSSLRCTGFSLSWLLLLQSMGSRRVGLSSCGTRAELLRGMWDLPRPELEPVSPALGFPGAFLTTVPPGKPWRQFLIVTTWREAAQLASTGRRPGMLLNILQCTGQPPTANKRIILSRYH